MDKVILKQFADKIRLEAMRMVYEGGDGHPGPAMSIADIVAVLYFYKMNIRPDQPDWADRDRLILSKGHACPIVYAALSEKGYYGALVEKFQLREFGSIFQGHPVMGKTPGVDFTSGSLGNGIAIGAGIAISGKLKKCDYTTYVIVGDGELQEGVIWEGANVAVAHKLDNLIVFVDCNNWQSGDQVDKIIGSNNATERFSSFNFHTQEIDGHNHEAIANAIDTAKAVKGRPCAIICNTVKGKGLPYMEHDNSWHKRVPTEAEYQQAITILKGER